LRNAVLLALAAVALPAVALAATAAISYDTPLDINGIGPIKLGMSVREAERASGMKMIIEDPLDDPSCVYGRFAKGPEGIAFMVADGRIARVDIMDQAKNKTAQGAAIGWTEDRIKNLYGKAVKVTNHAYVEGHYLTIKTAGLEQGKLRYVFETEHGKVTQFRSGREPEVEYAEGCA